MIQGFLVDPIAVKKDGKKKLLTALMPYPVK